MEFGLKCNRKGVGAVTEAVLILFDSFQLLSAGHVAFPAPGDLWQAKICRERPV